MTYINSMIELVGYFHVSQVENSILRFHVRPGANIKYFTVHRVLHRTVSRTSFHVPV